MGGRRSWGIISARSPHTSAPRVLLYVQHLVGIGHLRRMAAVAHALATAGAETMLVSGGYADANLLLGNAQLVQLPPARAADTRYRTLLGDDGQEVDDAWRNQRRQQLLAVVRGFAPDAVVIETYPFGRRLLRFELEPLCALVQTMLPRPQLWCSVRDILEDKRNPERYAQILDILETFFDAVLVHADPSLVRLQHSFPRAHQIAVRIHYTGYVRQPDTDRLGFEPPVSAGEVIVSAGGGAVGHDLLGCALHARRLCTAHDRPWRILLGSSLTTVAAELAAQAPPGVTVEINRADFPTLLTGAALSISQAGYNTVVNILASGVRSILVPFEDNGQREQSLRAELLVRRGRVQLVRRRDLNPAALAAAIDHTLLTPIDRGEQTIALNGAQTTAAIVLRSLG